MCSAGEGSTPIYWLYGYACAAGEGMVFEPFDLVKGIVFKSFGLVKGISGFQVI